MRVAAPFANRIKNDTLWQGYTNEKLTYDVQKSG
jgi:hypothetical protein